MSITKIPTQSPRGLMPAGWKPQTQQPTQNDMNTNSNTDLSQKSSEEDASDGKSIAIINLKEIL